MSCIAFAVGSGLGYKTCHHERQNLPCQCAVPCLVHLTAQKTQVFAAHPVDICIDRVDFVWRNVLHCLELHAVVSGLRTISVCQRQAAIECQGVKFPSLGSHIRSRGLMDCLWAMIFLATSSSNSSVSAILWICFMTLLGFSSCGGLTLIFNLMFVLNFSFRYLVIACLSLTKRLMCSSSLFVTSIPCCVQNMDHFCEGSWCTSRQSPN